MELTLTTKIDIPNEVLADVLTTAVEGGINYWGSPLQTERDADLRVVRVLIEPHGEENNRRLVVDRHIGLGVEALHRAIMRGDVHPESEIGAQFLRHLFADQAEDGLNMVDSVCADAIVQMACFGKIVYG